MQQQGDQVFVVGVGMTSFVKPGSRVGWDYPDMVKEAVSEALKDANLQYSEIQQAVASFVYGQTCSGQRALYTLGMTGLPVYNVNNACASGSSAINLARQIILSGVSDCVLAVGFEKMKAGSLDGMAGQDPDSVHPMDKHVQVVSDTYGFEPAPMTAQMFGNAARDHMKLYGTLPRHFAKIAWKNHKHSVYNKRSQFQKEYSMEEITSSTMIHDPLTKLQCCPTSDGSAAAILCSRKFLDKFPSLKARAVEIVGMTMATDLPSAFSDQSNIKMIGFDAVKKAANELYKSTGLSASDVQVIELHDCFSANELISYEALGLCAEGKAAEIVDKGDNTYGGKWVINPSGGLISKGHPLGATGIAQCAELCWQLRGEAGQRQVPGAKVALQHNIGLGGAVILALYRKFNGPNISGIKKSLESAFKSDVIFHTMNQNAAKNSEKLIEQIGAIFEFLIKNETEAKKWIIDFSSAPASVVQHAVESNITSHCQITISDTDMMNLFNKSVTPDKLFMNGRMKIRGNISKAMKLQKVLESARINAKL